MSRLFDHYNSSLLIDAQSQSITVPLRSQSVPIPSSNSSLDLDNIYSQSAPAMLRTDSLLYETEQEDDDLSLVLYQKDEFDEWSSLANHHYGPRQDSNQMFEKLKHNSFYHILLKRSKLPIKVSNISSNTMYKRIRDHFCDINVLFIRYIRPLKCAYVVYKSYQEALKGYYKHHLSIIDDHTVVCHICTVEEMENDCNAFNKPKTTQKVRKKRTDLVMFMSPQSPVHFIILKPLELETVKESQLYEYWPVSQKKQRFLNQLYESSYHVYFLFSVIGSKSFQGYGTMSSPVIDMHTLAPHEMYGVVINPQWRFVCKINWESTQHTPIKQIGGCLNPYEQHQPIRYSRDFTLVEPTLGMTLIGLMK